MIDKASSQWTVSIIVPVFDGGDEFVTCMASLAALEPAAFEVVVVTDGGVDADIKAATAAGVQVVIIEGPAGPAVARNAGAAAARGDILFFVDGDVMVPPDAVRLLLEQFQHDPGLDAVIGSYDDSPSAPGFISQYRNLLHHYVHQMGADEASTFWGACGGILRETFVRIGGFSRNYPRPSIEDIELGYRLKREGCRIRLDKRLQVKHLKSWSLVSMLKTDLFYRAIPWTRLILSTRMLVDDLNVRLSNRISAALMCLVAALVLMSVWLPWMLWGAGAALLVICALNLPLYRFFVQKRGWLFTIRVIPMNWLYHLYSAMGFAIGAVLHTADVLNQRQVDEGPPPNHSIHAEGTLKSRP